MTTTVEQRLRAVEDKLDIIELEASYARTFDEHDGEGWSALFTTDGIYQSRPVGEHPPLTHVQGTDALREYCSSAPFNGIHFLHLPQLSLSGDSATARIHLEFHGSFHQDPGAPRMAMRGYYDVSYRLVAERWLIAHRVTTAFSREQDTIIGYPTVSGIPSR